MARVFDIRDLLKLLMIVLAAVMLLSGCSDKVKGAFDQGESSSAISPTQAADTGDPAQGIDCWQGHILNILYDVIGQTIMTQYDNLSAGSLSIMMLAFAIWLALRLLKFVSSVTESSPAEVWNEIIKKAFVCLFCAYLAYSSGTLLYVINYFLFPIYGAFLEFGSQILDLAQNNVRSVTVFNQQIDFQIQDISCSVQGDTNASLDAGFPPAFQNTMNCMICTLVDRLRLGRQMALVAMSMDGLLPWLTGLLVFAIFYVVGFGFVFYLVDSIFRLGMMILMLPIFIMAYAFGPTKKWTGIGFSNIMYSAAFMMAFSIIIATVLLAMISLIADPETGGIFNPQDPETHFQQISLATLCLLLLGFLVFGSMAVSQQLTSSLIGGNIEARFQQNLKAVGQAALGVITGGFAWVARKVAFYENNPIGRALNRSAALKQAMNRIAGRPQEKK